MRPIDLIGQPVAALDTPVLLVDLDVLERNIGHMKRVIVDEAGVRWRPHTKGMKTPALAHLLQRRGAQGITCAKLAEAEIMAYSGIDDILIANQIVGPQKAERLARAQGFARVMSAVDSVAGVEGLVLAVPEGWKLESSTDVEAQSEGGRIIFGRVEGHVDLVFIPVE